MAISRTQTSIEETVKRFLRKYVSMKAFDKYAEEAAAELVVQIASINDRIDEVVSETASKDEFDTLSNAFDEHVQDYTTRIAALEEAVNILNERVDAAERTLSNHESRIYALEMRER